MSMERQLWRIGDVAGHVNTMLPQSRLWLRVNNCKKALPKKHVQPKIFAGEQVAGIEHVMVQSPPVHVLGGLQGKPGVRSSLDQLTRFLMVTIESSSESSSDLS